MPNIKPGDVFYDNLGNGRYERCILQATTGEEADRMAAARGGTGEFYQEIPQDEARAELAKGDDSERLDNAQMIFDVGEDGMPRIVFLERV